MSAKSLPHKFADIVSGVRQLTKLLDTVGDHLDEDEIEQLSRVVLAGQSFGAFISLIAAGRRPVSK